MLALLLAYLCWASGRGREIRGSRTSSCVSGRRSAPLPGREERLAAFSLTVALWSSPASWHWPSGPRRRRATGPAIAPRKRRRRFGAALLFVLPVDWRARRFTLRWSEACGSTGAPCCCSAADCRWPAMFRTGLAEAVGQGSCGHRRPVAAALTVLFTLLAILLTETTSNTAAATMVGRWRSRRPGRGGQPRPAALGVALGASMAFMLPVSTPPNAIVYGWLRADHVMLRLGTVLDLASAIVVRSACCS